MNFLYTKLFPQLILSLCLSIPLLSTPLHVDRNRLQALYLSAQESMEHGHYTSAKAKFLKIIAISQGIGKTEFLQEAKLDMANVELLLGDLEQSKALLEELKLTFSKEYDLLEWERVYAHLECKMGNCEKSFEHFSLLSNFRDSSEWLPEEQKLFKHIQEELQIKYKTLYLRADNLMKEERYTQALPFLQKVINAHENGYLDLSSEKEERIYKHSLYLMGRAHYKRGEIQESLTSLLKQDEEEGELYTKSIFLLAKSYEKLKKYKRSNLLYTAFLQAYPAGSQREKQRALWGLGKNHYSQGRFKQAKVFLHSLPPQSFSQIPTLYLAHIHLKEGNLKACQDILSRAKSPSTKQNAMFSYLEGELAFQKQQYALAADFYEQSLALEEGLWSQQARRQLAKSYETLSLQSTNISLQKHFALKCQ